MGFVQLPLEVALSIVGFEEGSYRPVSIERQKTAELTVEPRDHSI